MLDAKDVKIAFVEIANDKLRMTITHKPTREVVSGEGNDYKVLHDELMAKLEERFIK